MKKLYIFIAVMVMALVVNCVIFGVVAVDDGTALVVGNIPEPSESVTAFFDAVKQGDYDEAMRYVDNYESLGFEEESSELIELYKKTLIESYEIELIDAAEIQQPASELKNIQRVRFTFLDCRLLLAAVSEKTSDAALVYMNDGNVIDSDEKAMEFVYDALKECLQTPEIYCSTEQFDVNLNYDGENWKIVLDDALYDALFGYIGNLSAEEIK